MFAPNSPSPVREAARNTLMKLYKHLGCPKEFAEFYPIRLPEVIALLGWTLKEEASLGFTPIGETLQAKCDFPNKTILITSEALQGPESAFTLAHEIGHAALHRHAPVCLGGTLVRRASTRRQRQNWPLEEKRIEREADVFASELLMPGKAVRYYFGLVIEKDNVWRGSAFAKRITRIGESREIGPQELAASLAEYEREDLFSLKTFFGVSRAAMATRLVELDLVG
jgi:hypothetical protein